ncbi:MAG: LapA family protein [Candidatus Zixiibacteriota bacterium]
MGIIRSILILIVLAIIIGFSVYNAEPRVTVDLIRWKYEVPLVVVVYWSFLAGMLAAFILGLAYVLKVQSDRRNERRDRRRLEMEISALRNRTIEELDQL